MQVCAGASQSCQDKIGRWVSPDRWTKHACQGKYSKRKSVGSPAMKPNDWIDAIWRVYLPCPNRFNSKLSSEIAIINVHRFAEYARLNV
jgi:hypothetical protein